MSDDSSIHLVSNIADRLTELHRGKRFHDFQMKVIKAIFEDGYKRIFIRKGRKGGGTECVLYPVCRIIGTLPNKSAYIIGPTQKAQSEIIWDNRRIHNYIPAEWNAKAHEQDKRIRLPNESFVKIEGADDPEAARGWEGDIFVWDEYKDHNPLAVENCYPNVAARDAIWIVLGTPPTQRTNHYYIKEQEIKNDPDWFFIHWTAWDNPFLPGGHEFLTKEKAKYIARGDWDIWDIEWEAKYVFNARRKVLPNFKPEHVVPSDVILSEIDRDKSNMRWVTCVDPGYATCFAVLFVGYNPYTSQLYIVDEIYSTDKNKNSVIDMWPLIERKQQAIFKGRWENIYDSAALSFAVEVNRYLQKRDGRSAALIPTSKSKTDEDEYFRAINTSYSELGRVKVAKHCRGVIDETENYETDEKDKYPNKNNHQLDNQRYIYKFLGYTTELIQGRATVVATNPRGFTPEEDARKQQKNNDFIGYGGEDAQFNPGDSFN